MRHRTFFLGIICLSLIGCSSRQVAQEVSRRLPQPKRIRITGTTNYQGPDMLAGSLYDKKGKYYGTYSAYSEVVSVNMRQNGLPAAYHFDVPEGDYVLVFEQGRILRRVVEISNRENAPIYDFSLKHGDVDQNGVIDEEDIKAIRRWLGASDRNLTKWTGGASNYQVPIPAEVDLNANGVVDADDIAIARANLGQRADPLPPYIKSNQLKPRRRPEPPSP